MKKVSSAALLALKLTWKLVLPVFLVTLGVQCFAAYRELMPGGVPLQAAFGFETFLRTAVQPAGKWWMAMLMALLINVTSSTKGSRSVYTMNRLSLSENQMTLVFGCVFTGYFLLYWAVQLLTVCGFFAWYTRFSLVSSNAFMLACWRSEWLHLLLPLGEWWGYIRNFLICASFGFCAAFAAQQGRRGKTPLIWIIAPLLCGVLLDSRVANISQDAALMILLPVFTIGYYFCLKGGCADEDL